MKQVTILGGGFVGGLIARDIAALEDVSVLVVDRDEKVLASIKEKFPKVETSTGDLSSKEGILKVIEGRDLVVGGLPAALGGIAIRTVIEAGINYVDISFLPLEEFVVLDEKAKEAGVTVICDSGIAPGLSNIMCFDLEKELKEVENTSIYVGGLPVNRDINKWNYVATWSPIDVFEEFTRMARVKMDGESKHVPSMSFREPISLPNAPERLECFVSDGLRTLVDTCRAKNMFEKTIRYEGHTKIFGAMVESGFFSEEEVELANGMKVKPVDLSTKLIMKTFERKEEEKDFIVMRVISKGIGHDGKKTSAYYDLRDDMDAEGNTAMSRCTGYVCSAVAKHVLLGGYKNPGVHGPEVMGEKKQDFEAIKKSLAERNVTFKKTVTKF